MAELDTSSGGGNGGSGVKKSKKMSTKVDLTPMVDLGFLLITFFMFATTLATPKAAKFRMPKDDVPENLMLKLREDAAMSVLIGPSSGANGESKRLYYYEGSDPSKIVMVKSIMELRGKIIERKKFYKTANIPDSVTFIAIKPMNDATYGDFMMARDEQAINNISSFMRVKPDPNELMVIEAYNKQNNIVLEKPKQ
jgi:Biopolymer transport protein ExbD/TolR